MQSLKCLLRATRFNESLLLGRVNSCHGFHERIHVQTEPTKTLLIRIPIGKRWDAPLHPCCSPL